MARHPDLTGDDLHVAHRWEYADAAARTGATGIVPEDVGKLALQLSDGSYWRLTDDSPVTWASIAPTSAPSGAAGGVLSGTYPNPGFAADMATQAELDANATADRARANHTGTQLAATISDFDTAVRANRLDQMAAPTADVSLNSHKLTNVTDPSSAQDAATKAYVDSLVLGLSWKQSARVATTAAGTLATSFENGDTVDGVTLVTGDRILIKNQATASENGIYVVQASGAPTRATDADSAADILQASLYIREGTANADTLWTLTTNAPITLGTTGLTFAQLSTGTTVSEGEGIDVTGGVVSVDVPGLTENASIDGAADFIPHYDTSAGHLRKIKPDDLPGGGGGASAAEDVTYDNATSGIAATDVQAALDEVAAAAGASYLAGSATLTAAASGTVSSLNGDTDEEWEITVEGTTSGITGGGLDPYFTLAPNGASTNFTAEVWRHYSGTGSGTNQESASGLSAWRLGRVGFTQNATIFFGRFRLRAKTGLPRAILGDFYHASSSGRVGYHVTGHWDDTSTNITSLAFAIGAGTITGRIEVRRVSR